jgi:hypothetical protein
MDYLLLMHMMVIVVYMYNHQDLIYKVFKKDMNGDGLIILIYLQDLFDNNGLLLIGLIVQLFGVLGLGKGNCGENMEDKLLLFVKKLKLK